VLQFGRINQLYVTDYPHSIPVIDAAKAYKLLVPRLKPDGNEVSGIATPEIAVPLASYGGWNVRGSGHARGDEEGGVALPSAAARSRWRRGNRTVKVRAYDSY